MELVELRDVSFSYDGNPALKRVSFPVGRGEFIGIVGPNGSGKSTLLKVVDGVLTPASGEALLSGRPVLQYKRRELARRVALVPQGYKLDFDFTAREVVEMGRYARKGLAGGRRGVEGLLDRLEIRELSDRPFTELSGGEKQMVVLAQALAQEPDLLLLDEPAAHLDVSYQLRLFDMLREQNREGLTVLCVLHDLNLALLYFEKLLMLADGEMVAAGKTEQVLSPDRIEAAYGVRAYMHRHAGKTFLTFSPRQRARRGVSIHLVCGGGSGSFLMRELTDLGFGVSAGVVNAMDTDEVTGRELGLELAAEAPFTTITGEAHAENMELVRGADIVILTEVPIGAGNIKNIAAVREAAEIGKQVWVIEGLEDRDFTGTAKDMLGDPGGIEYFHDSGELMRKLREKWES